MKIDTNLLKEIRETGDWLLAFPDKLVSAVMEPRENYLRRRDRIKKLKEIAELREVAKTIQSFYMFKGSLVRWIEILQSEQALEDCAHVRELLQDVRHGPSEIKSVLTETSISSSALGADAAMCLSRAELAYKRLSELPDEVLLNDTALANIAAQLERQIESGSSLLRRLDEHRNTLDHSYGN